MIGALLLLSSLQASSLVRPMYLSERPPETRCARNILLVHEGATAASAEHSRSREEALELAGDLVRRLRDGESFERMAETYSQAGNARTGAVLGSFAPGMLAPELDRFLFSAAIDEISEPLATRSGVHILQRIESHAAVLQILVSGQGDDARARCDELLARMRGPSDTLLKAAAFDMPVGEIAGPFESPLGFHILKRVRLDEIDPERVELNFVRVRAILVQFDVATGADMTRAPTVSAAKTIADELMRTLARAHDDDPGGKEREGDLGWIYRHTPELSPILRRAFLMRVDELSEPTLTSHGWLILRRER
jgi:parvulin-like peptidyl-prolyl isomerase